jgi:hypothetical protein
MKLRIAGILLCLGMGYAVRVAAQEPISPSAPVPPATTAKEKSPAAEPASPPQKIEESFPSIFYLKDEHGNLQAVPNFTLKDFEDLYKLKHQLVQGDPRPRYSLQQMLASGTINSAGQAELTVQFRIVVREDQWTRIPLRLDQGVLREPAQYQGPGENLLSFEGEGEGYVAWLRGPAGQTHQLTLKLLVPLTSTGQESRLKLLAPRTTASELKLTVPYVHAVARVSEGATLQAPRGNDKETELIAVGLNGDFELSWHPPGYSPGKPAALEAFGSILSRLDGRGVETDATFSVRSFGEAFDRFHIRLPPDSELVPGKGGGYTLAMVDGTSSPAAPGRPRTVEVQLARRTTGPVEIRFTTKRAVDPTRGDRWLELAGFEIPEAARQSGTIAVSVAGDWQVLWGSSRGVRQIDPPETMRQKEVVSAYEYFALPSSMMARLVQRKTRINVDPEYVILVDSDQVRMEAKLRYTVRGAKVSAVSLAMPDWQIDDIGPESVVAVDGVPPDAGPMLALPLMSPTVGQFEIRLKAHRPLPPDAKTFSLTLPQIQASAPPSAVVAVLPADNVEIAPVAAAMTGLMRQQSAGPMELPVRQQEPLFFRTDAAQAVFTAEIHRHRQWITVGVNSQLSIEPTVSRVEQKFSYSVAYEPTDFFLLEVPRELAAKGRLELSCEDQILAPVVLGDESDDEAKPLRMRVALPKPCIGHCEIAARFTLPPSGAAGELRVPLVMPLDVELAGNNLSVVSAADQQVDAAGSDWTVADSGVADVASPRTRGFSAVRPTNEVVLKLHGESGDAPVTVERAWLQTFLSGGSRTGAQAVRQDTLVFQFTTRLRHLEINLPPGAASDGASVKLFAVNHNGSSGRQQTELTVAPSSKGDRTVLVPLPMSSESARYSLSLQYHVRMQEIGQGTTRFEFPQIGNNAWVNQMYWQLLLPAEEHLLATPRGFTSEFDWRWNAFYFGRQPVMDEAALAAWVGLPRPMDAYPTTGLNCYLFSTLGPLESCEIATLGRTTIVFVVSGVVLLVGLGLIYFRPMRHPIVLLAAVVLLASSAAMYPELTLLAAQASVLGLVLVLLAFVLRRWFEIDQPTTADMASSVTLALQVSPATEVLVPAAAPAASSKSMPVAVPSDAVT